MTVTPGARLLAGNNLPAIYGAGVNTFDVERAPWSSIDSCRPPIFAPITYRIRIIAASIIKHEIGWQRMQPQGDAEE
jgi:hypothetical protein